MSTTQPLPASHGEDADRPASSSASSPAGPLARRPSGRQIFLLLTVLVAILALLFGVPLWLLVFAGAEWPAAVEVIGTLVFVAGAVALPIAMYQGHRNGRDNVARFGDTLLGVIWVVFVWSILGNLVKIALTLFGSLGPTSARVVTVAVLTVVIVLLAWGYREAMRVPDVRRVEVVIPRLGAGLDGVTIALLTDTHYGPIDRTRWSHQVTDVVNSLDADIVCHTGDIADGTVEERRGQAAPLGDIRARLARAYVTGNHEYFGEAQGWLDHMRDLGWEPLHNRHLVVERGGDRLVLAGIDDRTAAGSGRPGHGADIGLALRDADPNLPVVLLAHQPKQVTHAVSAGVDLQISGHTHGGQLWPFGLLVLLDQPSVSGLSRHGDRTQLYTSRGTGFWGPPFRIFAPSEITLLTLRSR